MAWVMAWVMRWCVCVCVCVCVRVGPWRHMSYSLNSYNPSYIPHKSSLYNPFYNPLLRSLDYSSYEVR